MSPSNQDRTPESMSVAELVAALAEVTRQRDAANQALSFMTARFMDLRRRVKELVESIQ